MRINLKKSYQTITSIRNYRPPCKERMNVQMLSLIVSKTIKHSDDAVEKRILLEEAERRLLAAYIAGLRGEVGRQVRLRMPHSRGHTVSRDNRSFGTKRGK